MTDPREPRLSEEQARALWRRAAELQAEAARRLEERSHSLAGGDADPGADEATGFSLADVRAAAVEAGISEEFVGRALADITSDGSGASTGRADRMADRFLGDGPRELVVSRVFGTPAAETYAALQRYLPAPPVELALRDTLGGHPLEGGTLVFDVPPLALGQADGLGYELRGWADIKEVHLTLRPVGDDGRRTEVTLRAPLASSRRVNLWVGTAVLGSASLPVGIVASLVAGAVAASAGVVAVPAVAVAAGGVAAGGSLAGGRHLWRRIWRYGIGRGETALSGVLARVAAHMRTSVTPGPGELGWPAPPGAKDGPA